MPDPGREVGRIGVPHLSGPDAEVALFRGEPYAALGCQFRLAANHAGGSGKTISCLTVSRLRQAPAPGHSGRDRG